MERLLKFLAGFAVGLLLGSALVGLAAPRSGARTRQQIRQRFQAALEEARHAADDTRSQAHIRLAELKARQTEE